MQQTQVKTTWNPQYMPMTADGKPIINPGRYYAIIKEDEKNKHSANPDRFFVEETGEWCLSIQCVARNLNLRRVSIENRVARGSMVYYTTFHHQRTKMRMNAFPEWQFDPQWVDLLKEIHNSRSWTRENSQTKFYRSVHPLLGCTPQEAIVNGRGDQVLRIAKLQS